MKRSFALQMLAFLFLTGLPCLAQSKIIGDWETLLIAGQQKLKIIIHINQDSTGYTGTLDSPDQGAFKIPVSNVDIAGDTLKLKDVKTTINITGVYQPGTDSLNTVFKQGGFRTELIFGRSTSDYNFKRPQTPKPPFPYKSEDVVFANTNAGNIKLAGTLTIPENVKNPPVAILISGSGPQDRNEALLGHEPFLILADHLSRNGIAVLRYDDRGIAKSEGIFAAATSYDFSTDAEAAMEYLMTRKDVDINKIGLIGHSEGGMIAPMIAARNNKTAFIILLAGPGATIDKLMLKQLENLAIAQKMPEKDMQKYLKLNDAVMAVIRGTNDKSIAETRLNEVLAKHNFANGNKKAFGPYIKEKLSPWFSYFLRFTPSEYLEKVKCPVLALNGQLDKQVDADMNLEAIGVVLKKAKNPDYTIEKLPGLNHLFQEATTGNGDEYIKIEQTMSPKALETVSNWIKKRF